MTRAELLSFMRGHRIAVEASVSPAASPQAAAIGIVVTDDLEVVFDTIEHTRKFRNLTNNPAIALVIGGAGPGEERTVQYEGVADIPAGPDLARVRQLYLASFPDGRERLSWPGLTYVRVTPRWIRYTDFTHAPPEVAEFSFGESIAGRADVARGDLVLSTNASRMDVDAIHRYLSEESYWARGIPREVVARSIAHSLCFGIFDGERQVAFARVVSDRATYAYLCDVYVLEGHRGRGLATWLLESIDRHPDLAGLRRWSLVTRDAHALYGSHGYVSLVRPEGYMERVVPDIYSRPK